jgi:hypothetical protein
VLRLDLEMIPNAVFHSVVRLGPVRCDHARRYNFKERKKVIFSIKIKLIMKV